MNYLMYNDKKFEISEAAAKELSIIFGSDGNTRLADIPVGDTFKVGKYEFIVLEQLDGKTAVIKKDLLNNSKFCDDNNNCNGSIVDDLCIDFAKEIADVIGSENVCEFEIDLTAANGMSTYGTITRKSALLTAEQVKKYAYVLKEHTIDKWWWLATANGTPDWGTCDYVLCVSPSGFIYYRYYNGSYGVRPFCIFNSNSFVSK